MLYYKPFKSNSFWTHVKTRWNYDQSETWIKLMGVTDTLWDSSFHKVEGIVIFKCLNDIFYQKLSRLGKRALYWKSSNKWSTSFYPFPDMVLRNFDIRGTAVHLCSKSRARSYWKASTNWRKYRTNLGFRLYWKTDEKTGSRSWNWKFLMTTFNLF